eukprot:TRINITY_DN2271_c0_g1_i3.p2 TRINITY_DN2271_c0_g1~~TRINITY_DN2271_c0_g1_i3.p2  ORF type:complete len:116 (+),score=29.16 TRINITY_DN2271_c0_g1_i3:61-408(+)
MEQAAEQQEIGPGGVPRGAQTHQYYHVSDIPARFDNPDWFQGYGGKKQHPMYRTSASTYGGKTPSVHTMPTQFYAKSQKFTEVCVVCVWCVWCVWQDSLLPHHAHPVLCQVPEVH